MQVSQLFIPFSFRVGGVWAAFVNATSQLGGEAFQLGSVYQRRVKDILASSNTSSSPSEVRSVVHLVEADSNFDKIQVEGVEFRQQP